MDGQDKQDKILKNNKKAKTKKTTIAQKQGKSKPLNMDGQDEQGKNV